MHRVLMPLDPRTRPIVALREIMPLPKLGVTDEETKAEARLLDKIEKGSGR